MKNIFFSLFLITAPLVAEELEIIESIPLDDMSDIHIQPVDRAFVPAVTPAPVIIEDARSNDEPAEYVEPVEVQPEKWVSGLSDIHTRVETKKSYLRGIVDGQEYGKYTAVRFLEPKLVKQLYRQQNYETFWITSDFDINANLFDMVDVIKNSPNLGIDGDYHLSEIIGILDELKNDAEFSPRDRNLAIAQIDVLLTDAFFAIAKDTREGEIDFNRFESNLRRKAENEDIGYKWENPKRGINYVKFLKRVSGGGELEKELLSLASPNELYVQMLDAYNRYKSLEVQGGWPRIKRGKKIKIGVIDKKRIPLLAERLNMTGDLASFNPNVTVLTQEMVDALRHYQTRMGIWPSGILTDITLNALNVSVEKRVKKIKLNLERMRWEGKAFGSEYIWVNIPDFKMRFMKDGIEDIQMRVVVGRKQNPTPIFSSKLSYMVLNPTWGVPKSIVSKEMLRRIQENPDYFDTHKFKLYQGKKEVDGSSVDWWQYDEYSDIPFHFVRSAGPGNPLGAVKFMFPNKYAVYMHDTPQKKLFKNSKRAYSHGCIRLHEPQMLLEYMSNNYTQTAYEDVRAKEETGKTQSVKLDHSVPVHITYYTAWASSDGSVNFRNDIYGYDKMQYKLIEK